MRLIPALFLILTANAFAALPELPNEACRLARIDHLQFDGIQGLQDWRDYCQMAVGNLPPDVSGLLEKVADLNNRVAAVFGEDPTTIFSMKFGITVSADYRGSRHSEAEGGRVFLNALPDWTVADFPSQIYVHEVVHVLTFRPGIVADALKGVAGHPLLIEAFPDLIAATVQDSAKIRIGERNLPECLSVARNEMPLRSFDEPFRLFYLLADIDTLAACCATIDLSTSGDFVKGICGETAARKSESLDEIVKEIRKRELEAADYSADRVAAKFNPNDCRTTTRNGLVFLDNCDSHQFAYPIVSFFFRLKQLTGKSQVTAFFQKLREGAPHAAVYECHYSAGTSAEGGARARLAIRPLLTSLMALRSSFSRAQQAAFDQAWREHAFGKMVDLDRIYRIELLSGMAQLAVDAKNESFGDRNGCNIYHFDPAVCGVRCEKKR